MGKRLFPRLAAQNMRKNRRFFLPYLLALMGLSAAFYVMAALAFDPGVNQLRGLEFVRFMMVVGLVVAGLFSAVLLLYINSFLMRQRKKELGLYNILGMGKGAIALLQCWESLYTALTGIGGGLVAGMVLHMGAVALLGRLIPSGMVFHARVFPSALMLTAAVFAAMLALSLALNLLRVRLSRPIELLRGGSVGEKEPRTRWLLALVGVLALGGGYSIAVTVTDPAAAVFFYFLAVVLVIIGTYCLFTAVSVAVLKLLRRSKRFYYQTGHFIGVSGMLYRMKRNAVGLANICILSTMVMVMVSGTLSLYLGTGEIIAAQYPADFQVEVRHTPGGGEPFDPGAVEEMVERFAGENGVSVEKASGVDYLRVTAQADSAGKSLTVGAGGDRTAGRTVYVLTADSYAALTGSPAPALQPGQAAVCGQGEKGLLTLQAVGDVELPDGSWVSRIVGRPLELEVAEVLPPVPYFSTTFDIYQTLCLVVPGQEALEQVYDLVQASFGGEYSPYYNFLGLFDLACTAQEALALSERWWDFADGAGVFDGTGSWDSMYVTTRAEMEVGGYSMAGGFLFLGIVLGVIFLMATALIIYYKQISEGYEDQERFAIMQKVGLTKAQVRRTIRSQVLMVFFLPILVAAVHILFDFNLVVRLLSLFSVRSVGLIALCTGGTLLVFCLVYAAVYLLTARTYYKIVD